MWARRGVRHVQLLAVRTTTIEPEFVLVGTTADGISHLTVFDPLTGAEVAGESRSLGFKAELATMLPITEAHTHIVGLMDAATKKFVWGWLWGFLCWGVCSYLPPPPQTNKAAYLSVDGERCCCSGGARGAAVSAHD